MIRTLFLTCFTLLLASPIVLAQSRRPYDLPTGALVIETQPIVSRTHPGRALVLWMLNPKTNPRDTSDDVYTCPEYTRGSYYSGPTRVSLMNVKTRRVINTVKVRDEDMEADDSFDLPFKIKSGLYYHVTGGRGGHEGKPTIMWLRDYNGDGSALEFALFDAEACMGLATTLIGYSERQDEVIQYPIELQVKRKGINHPATHIMQWCDYLFSKGPIRPGYWKYEVDYSGRGGTLDKYSIRYNRAKEIFEGTFVSTTVP